MSGTAKEALDKMKREQEEEDKKIIEYNIELNRREREKLIKEEQEREKKKEELAKFLEMQIAERKKQEEFEEQINHEQSRIFRIDDQKFREDQKIIEQKIERMNKRNLEKLLQQIREKREREMKNEDMTPEEIEMNRQNLEAYIERKLFSINTGHASIAYFAYQKGYTDIAQAMKDPEILDIVRRVWKETGTHLINKFGFDPISHWKYVETCENRFKNPYLSDDVTRVARGPKRKISHKDRLILPARDDSGGTPEALASVVAAALKYDYKEDKEAMEIQDFIKKNGIENAIVKYTGLEKYTKLFKLIMSYV